MPKQLQKLNGIPLAIHPGLQFRNYHPGIELVYVVARPLFDTWKALLESYFPAGGWQLAEGGNTRYQSVKNGLSVLGKEDTLVAIHDGARPFVSVKTIRHAFDVAMGAGNAVLAVPAKDSIRRISPGGSSQALKRDDIFYVQTPQIFRLSDLLNVYKQPDDNRFTDDATVMELAGYPVHLVEGSYDNIKVTTPEDWHLAELILRKQSLVASS